MRCSISLKYWPTVGWITQTYRTLAWGALSASAMLYSATCIVLYMHHCTMHNYHIASMRCRGCHQQIRTITLIDKLDRNCDYQSWTTTEVVDDTTYSFASAPSWMWTSMADEHTFLAVRRLSRRLLNQLKTQFLPTAPPASGAPLGWSHQNFVQIFCVVKRESLGYRAALFAWFYI